MYSILYKLGLIPLLAGMLAFLGTVAALYVSINSGALELGETARALQTIGLPVAGAVATLVACITALVSGRVTARVRKGYVDNARNELAHSVVSGALTDGVALLKHFAINYDEVLAPSVVPEWLHGENRKNKDVLEIQEFICKYVVPMLPPQDRPLRGIRFWYENWIPVIEELVGAYHRVAGKLGWVQRYIMWKFNPQRLAMLVLNEFEASHSGARNQATVAAGTEDAAGATDVDSDSAEAAPLQLSEGSDTGIPIEGFITQGEKQAHS